MTRQYRGKLQTVIEEIQLPNPVIRSHYGNGFIKQHVRDHLNLRTEPATNNVADYGIKKAIEHLPALRAKLSSIIDSYLNVQQDILETFVDRGQLHQFAQPTVLPNGRRIPGLKLDHPRQLALMHALVRFANIAAANTFTTQEVYPHTLRALGSAPGDYSLASLRYDLYKLRAKGLVHKLPRSRRYQSAPKAIRSAWSSPNSSSGSMRHLLPVSCAQFPATANYSSNDKPNLTASTSASPMISTNFSTLSVSSSPPERRNENKILITAPITVYAFSQIGLRKSGPFGAV